jgi:release factor glutamine methyltransferase
VTAAAERAPDIESGATLAATRIELARAFADAGLDTPALDARVIIQHALGCTHAALAASPERRLGAREAARIAALAARRLRREPVAHILGVKEFWGLPLRVTPATLVPRPETEALVAAALEALGAECRAAPLCIADLGTGSGAILLALLAELPQARGLGIDISAAAAAVARENAARLGLAARAGFAVGDFTASLGSGGVDLLVSNPPYVETVAIDSLPDEVRAHEPRAALDGGVDGRDFYRRLADDAGRVLAAGGLLAVEIGAGQADAVTALLAAGGLALQGGAKCDLAGIPRALVMRRQGPVKPRDR